MDLVELGRVADYLIRCGLGVRAIPEKDYVEVQDVKHVVHWYYPEKQLAVFYRDTGLGAEKRSVENLPLNKFAYVCKHPESLKW